MGVVDRKSVEAIDLRSVRLDAELLASIPVELMLRYSFVPLAQTEEGMRVAIADPGDLPAIDALEDRFGVRLLVYSAAEADIEEALRRADSSGRVLDKLTAPMRQLDAVLEIDEDSLTLERLATESSPPIIRLLDTTILNAIQKRTQLVAELAQQEPAGSPLLDTLSVSQIEKSQAVKTRSKLRGGRNWAPSPPDATHLLKQIDSYCQSQNRPIMYR